MGRSKDQKPQETEDISSQKFLVVSSSACPLGGIHAGSCLANIYRNLRFPVAFPDFVNTSHRNRRILRASVS
jgi:hypothetical protein